MLLDAHLHQHHEVDQTLLGIGHHQMQRSNLLTSTGRRNPRQKLLDLARDYECLVDYRTGLPVSALLLNVIVDRADRGSRPPLRMEVGLGAPEAERPPAALGVPPFARISR